MFSIFVKDSEKCKECGFCTNLVTCPGQDYCIGCQACYYACPFEAIKKVKDNREHELIRIYIDGRKHEVYDKITVKTALELSGFHFSRYPEIGKILAPCETGGCYACSLEINGTLKPACHTRILENMHIKTNASTKSPIRLVGGFTPHSVGGVGTPWDLKTKERYIEVACFAAGCNLRCPTCQNYSTTYDSSQIPLTPKEAAQNLSLIRRIYGVDRMAISGGEPTINKYWLLDFFKELKNLNPDKKARLHLDTNATVLTSSYIDQLVEAGVTDLGPDLKALSLKTFRLVTGIAEKELAKKYMITSWNAVEYIAEEYYPHKVFMGVGIPYNRFFHPDLSEIYEMGLKISEIDRRIQVCVLDYRPTFRRRDILHPSVEEMRKVKKTLQDAGLKTVIAQTLIGHLAPDD